MDYHKLMPGGQHLIKAFQRVGNLGEFVNNLNMPKIENAVYFVGSIEFLY